MASSSCVLTGLQTDRLYGFSLKDTWPDTGDEMMSLAGAGIGTANALPVGLRARLGGLEDAGLEIADVVAEAVEALELALREGTDLVDDKLPALKGDAEKVDVPAGPAAFAATEDVA